MPFSDEFQVPDLLKAVLIGQGVFCSLNCASISGDGALVAGGFSDSSLKVIFLLFFMLGTLKRDKEGVHVDRGDQIGQAEEQKEA